jgi:hypothetical protein
MLFRHTLSRGRFPSHYSCNPIKVIVLNCMMATNAGREAYVKLQEKVKEIAILESVQNIVLWDMVLFSLCSLKDKYRVYIFI